MPPSYPDDRLPPKSTTVARSCQVIFNVGTSSLLIAAAVVSIALLHSIYSIGPTQVGLVRKRFGAKLPGDNPLAFRGEAGYQAEMLMPGLRFKFCLVFAVTKHPWVQVPAGQIGVVIAQVGQALPIGAKSAVYKPEFGNFSDLNAFIEKGGQKGVQRPVSVAWHPGADSSRRIPGDHQAGSVRRADFFRSQRVGSQERRAHVRGVRARRTTARSHSNLSASDRGRKSRRHGWCRHDAWKVSPACGRYRQPPGRIHRYRSVGDGRRQQAPRRMRDSSRPFWATRMNRHSAYQDFQKFLQLGGKIGLQHDPLAVRRL